MPQTGNQPAGIQRIILTRLQQTSDLFLMPPTADKTGGFTSSLPEARTATRSEACSLAEAGGTLPLFSFLITGGGRSLKVALPCSSPIMIGSPAKNHSHRCTEPTKGTICVTLPWGTEKKDATAVTINILEKGRVITLYKTERPATTCLLQRQIIRRPLPVALRHVASRQQGRASSSLTGE